MIEIILLFLWKLHCLLFRAICLFASLVNSMRTVIVYFSKTETVPETVQTIKNMSTNTTAAFEGSFFAVSFALSIITALSIKYYISSTFHAAAIFPRITVSLMLVLSLYMGISLIVACFEYFNSTKLLYNLIRNREGYVNGAIFVLFGPFYLLPPYEVIENVLESGIDNHIKIAKRGNTLRFLSRLFLLYLTLIQG